MSTRSAVARSLVFVVFAAAIAALVTLGVAGRARAASSPVGDKLLPAVAGPAVAASVTLWVDIAGKRKDAAARLSATHAEMAGRGYAVSSVVPHVEDSDLQGFFVTYAPVTR